MENRLTKEPIVETGAGKEVGGKEFASSGNVGMLDVIAALEWVRDNIEDFGGDPRRVMVFGESGGGMKTSFLLASHAGARIFDDSGVTR